MSQRNGLGNKEKKASSVGSITQSRRSMLKFGLGGLGVALVGAVVGFELIDHGVLPGKSTLDELDGACSVDAPPLRFDEVGPSVSGHFFSSARQQDVGYTIAWPPGFKPGDLLPLVVMLHGDGGTHDTAIKGMSPAQLLALVDPHDPKRLKSSVPTALVTVDGGNGYWHPHPDDDPMGMVINELIPRCQARGLGNEAQGIGLMGISMGGYGAIVIAEHNPKLARAVAAISPAIWTEYRQAQGVNIGAYADAAEFEKYNAVTHARALEGLPVLVASGVDDPFHPGVVAFAQAAPASTTVKFESGCHTDPFFVASEPEALTFLSKHLGTSSSR
jgi:pimeloyl-ACP methyl ester carboxylesterase